MFKKTLLSAVSISSSSDCNNSTPTIMCVQASAVTSKFIALIHPHPNSLDTSAEVFNLLSPCLVHCLDRNSTYLLRRVFFGLPCPACSAATTTPTIRGRWSCITHTHMNGRSLAQKTLLTDRKRPRRWIFFTPFTPCGGASMQSATNASIFFWQSPDSNKWAQ